MLAACRVAAAGAAAQAAILCPPATVAQADGVKSGCIRSARLEARLSEFLSVSAIGWAFFFGMIWGAAMMALIMFVGFRFELGRRERKVRTARAQAVSKEARTA